MIDLFSFKLSSEKLDDREERIISCEEKLRTRKSEVESRLKEIDPKREIHSASLNKPQKDYQDALARRTSWETKRLEIVGSSSTPDSLKGLQERSEQLKRLPDEIDNLEATRDEIAREIFDLLEQAAFGEG